MAYTGRNNGFRSVMEQNTSSIESQRSLPTWMAAQTLERTMKDSVSLDIVDLPAEI